MNLILDVDGTLIDSDDGDIIARPYLAEFLIFVFKHFNTVSIWTNATPVWVNKVMDTVLVPLLPEGKNFYFVWTREKCVMERVVLHPRPYTRKPLSLVHEEYPTTHTSKNTVIVDDSPETYAHNLASAVSIETFRWSYMPRNSDIEEDTTFENCDNSSEEEVTDKELLRLIDDFQLAYFN